MRPLKVGIQLPEVERIARWREVGEMSRAIEDLGFDSIWVSDHLLYRPAVGPARGPWESWSTLAAVAAVTSRVELGPLVACTAFRNPGVLAKQATTLDEISAGRLILGLGAGWNEAEFSAFGFPFGDRVSRFEEAFTIICTLLRTGRIDFAGKYYEARDLELLPRGPRREGPPLMVGSVGKRMLRVTLPHVDLWNTWYTNTDNQPAGAARLRVLVDDICAEVGRDPHSVGRTVAVAVELSGASGRELDRLHESKPIQSLRGSAEQIADGLRAYAHEGISHVQLVLNPITIQSIEQVSRALLVLDRD